MSTFFYLRLHKITAGDELYPTAMHSNTGKYEDNYIVGQWMNRLILYSQMLKLTFAVRPNCEVPKLYIFGTLF